MVYDFAEKSRFNDLVYDLTEIDNSRVGPFKCLRGLDNQPFDQLSGRHDITHQGCRLTGEWQQVMASAGPDGG
jgi:hypothetical protein